MSEPPQSQVLIAGAGSIGLTAGIELTRRGIDCRIVDPLPEPPAYTKAVGVQPRTREIFEAMGVLPRILDPAIQMHGQLVYVNGEKARSGRVRHSLRSAVRLHRHAAVHHRAEPARGTRDVRLPRF